MDCASLVVILSAVGVVGIKDNALSIPLIALGSGQLCIGLLETRDCRLELDLSMRAPSTRFLTLGLGFESSTRLVRDR